MSIPGTQPTHYQVLGIASTATPEQIKRAYRARAKTLHPDVSDAPDAAVRFAQVAEAYEVLSDPARRRAYDRSLLESAGTRRSAARGEQTDEGGEGPTFRQGHYAWVNVAAPRGSSAGERGHAEIEELYETFFGSSARRQPSNDPASPASSGVKNTGATGHGPDRVRTTGADPAPTPPSPARSRGSRKRTG